MNQWGANNGQWPPILVNLNRYDPLKDANERYEVYVNNDYIGDKIVMTQGEEGLSSIKGFLESRGFDDVDIQTDGNQIRVETDRRDEARDIKRHLSVYLNIR